MNSTTDVVGNVVQNATVEPYGCLLTTPTKTPFLIDDVDVFNITVDVFLSVPIALLGIIGNVLSFFVFWKDKALSPSFVLLLFLSVVDTLFLLGNCCRMIMMRLLYRLYYLDGATMETIVKTDLFFYPFNNVMVTASTFTTILIAVDRFIVVVLPFRVAELCTFKRCLLQIVIVSAASLALNVPLFMELCFKRQLLCGGQIHLGTFISSCPDVVASMAYGVVFRQIIRPIMTRFAPLFLLAALNLKIIKSFRKSQQFKKNILGQTKASRSEKLSVTLITVVTVYIICSLPSNVWVVLYKVQYDFPAIKRFTLWFARISSLLVVINSSVNFLIYFISGNRFRMLFLAIFCTRIRNCVSSSQG